MVHNELLEPSPTCVCGEGEPFNRAACIGAHPIWVGQPMCPHQPVLHQKCMNALCQNVCIRVVPTLLAVAIT